MSSNSPNSNDSSSLRNLPQSFHFNPRMGSPRNNPSPYGTHKVNSDSPNFISFGSGPVERGKQPFRPFNNTPYRGHQKFRHKNNRNSFSSPNTSFNSSRNSSFSSVNSSFNSSQNFSPYSQKSGYDLEDWARSESYRSMFGNPWAPLENNLKQKFGDRLESFPDNAVHQKRDR